MGNKTLNEVLERYPMFEKMIERRFNTSYAYKYDNSSNCRGVLILRVLDDNKTLRLSITDIEDMDDLLGIVDLFEFDLSNIDKLHHLLEAVVF